MPRALTPSSSDEDGEEQCFYDGADASQGAFSELSSYCSGLTDATDLSDIDCSTSSETPASRDDDEEESCEDEDETDEATESSSTSTYSTHPSDTSHDLSTLVEDLDPEKLANFIRLRSIDKKWIKAAWAYIEAEPTFRRRVKMTKVVRKIRADIKFGFRWSELQREYYLRHPLSADGKTMQELRRLSLDAQFRPLPDLTV